MYYRYWGKTKSRLEIDYCTSTDSLKKIAARNEITPDKLIRRAHKYGWEKSHNPDVFVPYHLLPYHCLDVAAVGWILMHPENSLCRRLAEQLKVDAAWLRHWFVFCLMLHDIGKFARAFQNLVPDLSPELVPYRGQCICQLRYESLGYLFSIWTMHSEWERQMRDLLMGEKSWLSLN